MLTGSRTERLASDAKVSLRQRQATGMLVLPYKKRPSQVSRTSNGHTKKIHITRLPPEVLRKILMYLDASSLYSAGYVNKLFYQLANNNGMWCRIYSIYGEDKKCKAKPKIMDEVVKTQISMEFKNRPEGYWRMIYFRTIADYNHSKWRKEMTAINPYTGLPRHTERVLRSQRVSWEITLVDRSGGERTFEQSHAYFSDSSVTVFWSKTSWPSFHQLSSVLLHGVKRVPLSCSRSIRPRWRSLLAHLDIDSISKCCQVVGGDKSLSESSQEIGGDNGIHRRKQMIGGDRLVNLLMLSPGITVGIWRGESSIAFVMATFHYHMLVEKSLLGSSMCPYTIPEYKAPFDDVDPSYGLHGYTLHITLHNTVTEIMSSQFSQLFCRKGQIHGGFIQLNAISRSNPSQHTPLAGAVRLPWRSDALESFMEGYCVMSVTLLDDSQKPFWCFSTPVSMVPTNEEPLSYDYQGQHFLIKYQDAEGKLQMDVMWREELTQFFLINLVFYISTANINQHFGRTY
ncbi:hypothetical protein UPYG_G00074940 [Umbra pygmaea]|uniref:F-box domain-containing protein n=1 Tax=Umbra pygmaea TaxID=75934 RepID=A0ABD0XZZ1_UMBPY